MTFRFQRPKDAAPLQLTLRDERILTDVAHFGVLTAAHVRSLHFGRAGLRAAQVRLRRLFEHQLLDRVYFPLTYTVGGRGEGTTPAYALGPKGRREVNPGASARIDATSLHHDLVAIDLLVALRVQYGSVVQTIPEHQLWQRRAVAGRGPEPNTAVPVPDAAFVLPSGSYLVEVVHAHVRGGNRTFVEKLDRYRRLHHSGRLAQVFGLPDLRAVIVITPTRVRADGMRSLASRRLMHGRQLFWFGHYEHEHRAGVPVTVFSRQPVTALLFLSLDGEPRRLEPHSLMPPHVCTTPCAHHRPR